MRLQMTMSANTNFQPKDLITIKTAINNNTTPRSTTLQDIFYHKLQ